MSRACFPLNLFRLSALMWRTGLGPDYEHKLRRRRAALCARLRYWASCGSSGTRRELQKEGVLRRGVYYLVLVDLVEPIDLIQALDLHPVD